MKLFGKFFDEAREKISSTVMEKVDSLGQGIGQKIGQENCGICNQQISVFDKAKIADGFCCKDCRGKLSAFTRKGTEITLSQVKEQLSAREMNMRKLVIFQPTRTLGTYIKLLIDEENGQFLVARTAAYREENADVFSCEDVTNCTVTVEESKTEVLYEDATGKKISFMPPMYASAYNIYLDITVNIPYLDTIRVPINEKPIDNEQKLLFKYDRRQIPSMGGRTTNAEEVRASAQYQMAWQTAQQMQQALEQLRTRTGEVMQRMSLCPWCGARSSVTTGVCEHCGGVLDAK